MREISILPVEPADSGEILTLQRAAYVTEGRLYGNFSLPALVQSHDELRAELADSVAVKAVRDGRIIGAARARREDASGASAGSPSRPTRRAKGSALGCSARWSGGHRSESSGSRCSPAT